MSLTHALTNDKLYKEAQKNNGVIQLTNTNFHKVLGGKRDAHVVLLLTATNPQVGCTLCIEFESEFSQVAQSWQQDHPKGLSSDGESGLFFARADYEPRRNGEVFTHFKVNNVPRVFVLPPGDDMDLFRIMNLPAESGATRVAWVIQSLSELTGFNDYKMHEPINWGSVIITSLSTAIVTFIVKKNTAIAARVITSKAVWGVGTVFVIVLWISGYMFNSIRGSQYAGVSADGSKVLYFLEGQQQNQFGVETQIVSVIYGALIANILCLIKFVPYAKKFYAHDRNGKPTPSKAILIELTLALTFSSFLYLSYSALVAVFRLKSVGYPFKLFKFPSF